MVGVIFLLHCSVSVDKLLISYLVDKIGFTLVDLPVLSHKELKEISKDEDKFEETKNAIVTKTLDYFKQIKVDWNKNYVLYPVYFREQLDISFHRTYYIPFKIDVPLKLRYADAAKELALEEFLDVDEFINYKLVEGFDTQYVNVLKLTKPSEKALRDMIKEHKAFHIFLTNDIRMDWDLYFMNLAYVVRKRSNCMKRSVGCIVTRNKRIISVGYNGCPQNLKNCFQGGCTRCNTNAKQGEDLNKCYCLHAEESAILECGIQNSKDASIYCTLFPCLWCAKIIIHAQITRVYYCEDYNSELSIKALRESGIEMTQMNLNLLDTY